MAKKSTKNSVAPSTSQKKTKPRGGTPAPENSANPTNGARGDKPMMVGQYLIQRMKEAGIQKVFGIPGDYVLEFYDQMYHSMEVIGTTREDCAGFAADAYARIRGLGAVCITYCVGGLSVVNAVAGAYAEKSPLLVISGAPGLGERARNALLHHKVRDFETQRDIFEKITVATATLNDPLTVARDVDRVFDAILRYKRPGYIEIPRDQVNVPIPLPGRAERKESVSDPNELQAALEETSNLLDQAKRPVLLLGVEIHRFGLQKLALQLAEINNIPIASTVLGKSVVSEAHPLYVGVYEGAMGHERTRQFVEDADLVLMLGTFMTDINLGVYTANLNPARCVLVTSEDTRIGYHHYHEILLTDFLRELAHRGFSCGKQIIPKSSDNTWKTFVPQADKAITVKRLYQKINSILTEDMVVICDVGDALFAGADLVMMKQTHFLSPAYYTSMGFAVPAALGAQAADPKCRPIVMVGDGAFQMTGTELSTILRLGLNPIVIVSNNRGYSTERFLKEGAYNDIGNWSYHKITELLGGGWGFAVHTETDLEKAMEAALANTDSFSLLNVHLDPYDRSDALERLTSRLKQRLGSVSAK